MPLIDELLRRREVIAAVFTGPGTPPLDEPTTRALIADAQARADREGGTLLRVDAEDGWVLVLTADPGHWPGAVPPY